MPNVVVVENGRSSRPPKRTIIWRFDDGLIAEGWETIEPVAQASANLMWWEARR